MAQSSTARGNILTYILGFLALVSIVGATANFFFVAQYSQYDTEFMSQASTLAVQSQALPNEAQAALHGDTAAIAAMADGSRQMQNALVLLGGGDPSSMMPPASGQVAANISLFLQHWAPVRGAVRKIVGAKDAIAVATQSAVAVRAEMPVYIQAWSRLLARLNTRGYSRSVVTSVAAQPVMAGQTLQVFESMTRGEGDVDVAGNKFLAHVNSFGNLLDALENGSPKMNINALPDVPDLQAPLGRLRMSYKTLMSNLQTLAPLTVSIVAWQKAKAALDSAAPQLLSAAQAVIQTYRSQMAQRIFKPLYGYILGAIALLLITLLVLRYQLTGEARRAERAQEAQNERNQQAILSLMDDLGRLADGDLTVQLEVTDDITGAISDSINYTVEALRDLVKTINDTAVNLDSAARQTEATASHLAEASENQSKQIISATNAITQMAQSAEQVSENASRANDVARRSVDIANKGGDAVRRTIDSMTQTRESIQETAKRMKRLGESSQEIGDIVELINDIAEQTNILALNAAIQASTAGEAGRGFGVVADEVQRLAERSSGATRQIETLVRTIQADANEAILSMERSTSGVVSGAQLAENAGHSLDEIQSVSSHISKLIDMITRSARDQAQVAGEVSNTMGVIQEITSQTAEGTAVTARSIGKLAALATELRGSISGFTLPETGAEPIESVEDGEASQAYEIPEAAN